MEYGLSLGSNLGNRFANLKNAGIMINKIPGVSVKAGSSVYETEPVGVREENKNLLYLNSVLIVESALSPAVMLARLMEIEAALGRMRSADRNAPRLIDIDIIYADDIIMETASLTLPHPRWAERRFVVEPLAEVRPDLVIDKEKWPPVRELLRALSTDAGAKRTGSYETVECKYN